MKNAAIVASRAFSKALQEGSTYGEALLRGREAAERYAAAKAPPWPFPFGEKQFRHAYRIGFTDRQLAAIFASPVDAIRSARSALGLAEHPSSL